MKQNNRKPFGDIANTLGSSSSLLKAKAPETKQAVPFRVPSLSSAGFSAALSPPSPRFDEKNKDRQLCVAEYVKEIFEHLRRTEMIGRASPNYMSRLQTDVNEKMRTILFDWLVDVHLKFKLSLETLFLAAEIIDRFLDKKVVSRQKLQLVGVVGMLIASKYEEIYPPEVKDFIYIAANTYTRDDILRMERLMFSTLDFNVTVPTIFPFLKRALQVVEADTRMTHLAQCLAEFCLLDYKMLQHPPSLIAASCVYLANKYLARDPWSATLEHYCQYKVADVDRCSGDILTIVQNAPSQKTQAVRKKYSYAKYGEVTKIINPA